MEERTTIEVSVDVDTEMANERVKELIGILETANSLAEKLAVSLSNLKIDIKI